MGRIIGNVIVALLVVTPLLAVAIAVGGLLNGFVLMKLWGWFMVPTFGLPALTLAPAMGVGLTIGFLTYHHVSTQKCKHQECDSGATGLITIILYPLLCLLIGWIVQLFV